MQYLSGSNLYSLVTLWILRILNATLGVALMRLWLATLSVYNKVMSGLGSDPRSLEKMIGVSKSYIVLNKATQAMRRLLDFK